MPEAHQPHVVVITGASSDIGRAIALACAERGDILVLAARREGMLAAMAEPAALPLDLMALPLRLLDLGMTTGLRLLEAMAPAAGPGPVSE